MPDSLRGGSRRGLTARQRDAIDLLVRGERNERALYDRLGWTGNPEVSEPDGYGVVCADTSCLCDGQAWINWRTANALARRGLAVVNGQGEDMEVRLTDAGRELARV